MYTAIKFGMLMASCPDLLHTLRLNRIFKEAGIKTTHIEMGFFDSEPFVSMFQQMIGHDDPDIFLWHLLVRYEKEALVSLLGKHLQ
jgi:hypothetical protein